jgi:hypothetical protein
MTEMARPSRSLEWGSLRRELVALERQLDGAATPAELARIQKAGERLQARVLKLMRRSGQEAALLSAELEAFLGFAPTPEDLPRIVMACREREAELRADSRRPVP